MWACSALYACSLFRLQSLNKGEWNFRCFSLGGMPCTAPRPLGLFCALVTVLCSRPSVNVYEWTSSWEVRRAESIPGHIATITLTSLMVTVIMVSPCRTWYLNLGKSYHGLPCRDSKHKSQATLLGCALLPEPTNLTRRLCQNPPAQEHNYVQKSLCQGIVVVGLWVGRHTVQVCEC